MHHITPSNHHPATAPVSAAYPRTEPASAVQRQHLAALRALWGILLRRVLLPIHTEDPELVTRGRLLKGAALLVAAAALLNAPIALLDPSFPAWLPVVLGGVALASGAIFCLAHVGYIAPGGLMLSALLVLAISISLPPEALLTRPIGVAYLLPILIAGMVIGARGVKLFGSAALLAFALIAVMNQEAWSTWTVTALSILAIATGLLWLMVCTLEYFRDDARAQAAAARAAQQEIATREAQATHQALHDPLTALPNRALFLERLAQAITRTQRHPDYQFAVLFLDLDGFKYINDSLGHSNGDRLLQTFAQRIQTCLRAGDILARLGGDEFTILVDAITSVSDATRVADRIQEQLKRPFMLDGAEVYTSSSIGIALSTTRYTRAETLLRDADTAMYRAKALGKARYAIFDATMHTQVTNRLQLEMDLRRAIERKEFTLYYQPIISLKTGWIIGFEALVRYRHPQRGLVSPAQFIPLAEETGLIVPIGQWVLHEACWQLRSWQRHIPRNALCTISVNLSSKQFAQLDLVEQIAATLRDTGLEAHRLQLEITESALMENTEAAARQLAQLRALEVHLQIDDFGTGYSSLSMLHRFPIDTLKIDRSFVSTLGTNPESAAIVQAIVTLGHTLGLDVVAEGIETNAQLIQLRALGCDYGQGFFFASPMEARDAQVMLAAQYSGGLPCQWALLAVSST
jgi:diguanylate cyclase (GGDEF)-like protein